MSDEKVNKLVEFMKAFLAIEQEIEPFAEQRKELKKNFIENNWLTKEEIAGAIKALRFLKKRENIELFVSIYDEARKEFGSDEE